MICVNAEIPALEEIAEMTHSQVHSQEFPIEGRIFPFWLPQLTTEEGDGAPLSVLKLFQDPTHCNVRSVNTKCGWGLHSGKMQ